MNKQILIKKKSGELEPFSEEKLRRSLKRVGALPDSVERIVSNIVGELREGTTTQDIYKRAFSLLSKYDHPVAGKYSLKQAIMELGPTGHPFEKLVSELLKTKGFSAQVSVIVQGICITHEIDVVAEKENQRIMVECKFHNQPGIKTDVKVALYVQARFEDIQNAWLKNKNDAQKFNEAWLVTNTKLTSEAIRYTQCVGIKVLGWNYPVNEGLEVLIDRSGLHPVTCLTTLSRKNKQYLLSKNIVLSKELLQDKNILRNLGLDNTEIFQVEKEINGLCQTV